MNENNLTQDQLYALLQHASKKLGTTPQKLAETVNNGGLDGLSAGLGEENAARLQALLGDRQRAEQFLASPKVQALLQQVLRKQQS